jgi:hypothetical protein
MTSTFTRRRAAGSRGRGGAGELRPEPPHDVGRCVVNAKQEPPSMPGGYDDAHEHLQAARSRVANDGFQVGLRPELGGVHQDAAIACDGYRRRRGHRPAPAHDVLWRIVFSSSVASSPAISRSEARAAAASLNATSARRSRATRSSRRLWRARAARQRPEHEVVSGRRSCKERPQIKQARGAAGDTIDGAE